MPAKSKKSTFFPFARDLYERGMSIAEISRQIPDVHYNTLFKWFKEEGIDTSRNHPHQIPRREERVCPTCGQIFGIIK